MDWKDLPRKTDKVAIVGFHEKTRHLAPFDDPEYEIWTLNEEYNFDWVKRFDRHFQLHPRWDFSRTNNLNDPNHFLWLKNQQGPCIYCRGKGSVTPATGPDQDCPFCEKGVYTPKKREGVPLYMQQEWADVPGSIALPLNEISEAFLPHTLTKKHYYTSSVAYMIGLALLMGFKVIDMYGFDMGTHTEYHYQRANFEYWCGLAHGLGVELKLPGSVILTGKLYGYENMHTGFRQQLEMRKFNLEQQDHQVRNEVIRLEAQHDLLKSLMKENPEIEFDGFEDVRKKLMKKQALLNFISGAKVETDNLTKLYEGYMIPGTEEEGIEHPAYKENEQHVTVQYVENNNAE